MRTIHGRKLEERWRALGAPKWHNYVVKKDTQGVVNWLWRDPKDLNLPPGLEKRMREMLERRTIKLSNVEDKLIWCGAKRGKYSVKNWLWHVGCIVLRGELADTSMVEWEVSPKSRIIHVASLESKNFDWRSIEIDGFHRPIQMHDVQNGRRDN